MTEKTLTEIFKEIKKTDPILRISNDSIELIPFYWNHVLVVSFIPLIASIYVLTQQIDLKITLACTLLAVYSIYSIFNQLSYYNKIIINIKEKNIKISPNILRQIFFDKPKMILNRDIQNINFTSSGFASETRYIISITLKNTHQLKLISTGDRNTATKMVNALLNII